MASVEVQMTSVSPALSVVDRGARAGASWGQMAAGEGVEKAGAQGSAAVEQAGGDSLVSSLTRKDLEPIVESIGQVVSAVNKGLSIQIDDSTGSLVAQVIDTETNEVVRQIPPEEILRVTSRLRRFLGVLLDIEV